VTEELFLLTCRKCGFGNKEYSRFCIKCGTQLLDSQRNLTTNPHLGDPYLLQGRYKIIKQLGKGGMGVVYLAKDNRFSNRLCVVKEMKESLLSHNEEEKRKAISRFNAEADLLATMNHPNVPQVYDRFNERNKYYLVMEFVAGVDLKTLLDEHIKRFQSNLPEKDLIIFLFELCLALEYLHNHIPQILHRDIKPENIMLTKSGKIKLIDFGIAKFIQTKNVGTSIGTQGYAAPEQYKGVVEARTDIYALGATFHHLLTSRDPQLETPFDYPPVLELNPSIHERFAQSIDNMLQAELCKRPMNVRDIQIELKSIYPDIENRLFSYSTKENVLIEIVRNIVQNNEIFLQKNSCSKCGHENKLDSKFCIKCGNTLEEK
jgi:eukaryotic-like serine/threonine-protein kinase